jgi:S1-C subfamily serine protease
MDKRCATAKAGLRAGDVIVSLAGNRIDGADALVQAVGAHQPGQAVSVVYLRGGTRHTAQADLAAQPRQTSPASSG